MDQQSYQAYLELIRALLHCPKGDEPTVLHQHADLITPELLQIMQEVAVNLTAEGHEAAARFLRHWEAQLAHSLSHQVRQQDSERTEAYLQLMRALMEAPKGTEPSLLKANQALVDEGFVQTLLQVSTQAAMQGDQKTASYLHDWAAQISHMLEETKSSDPDPSTSPPSVVSNPTRVFQEPISAQDPLHWQRELEALLSQLQAHTQAGSTAEGEGSSRSTLQQEGEGSISALTKALHRLGNILKSRLQPSNPLWYMEVLERAQAANWILTTHEVEQLIGVKPRCSVGSQTFEWGSWVFEKSGRVGSQIAWHVSKVKEN